MKMLKDIYIALAQHSICLKAEYVTSGSNVVDALSRGDIAAFLSAFFKLTNFMTNMAAGIAITIPAFEILNS